MNVDKEVKKQIADLLAAGCLKVVGHELVKGKLEPIYEITEQGMNWASMEKNKAIRSS